MRRASHVFGLVLIAGLVLALTSRVACAQEGVAGAPVRVAEALDAYLRSSREATLPCAELAQARRLDLPALVASALCHRQLGAIHNAELDIREAQVSEARASYFPTAQLSVGRAGTASRYFGEFGYTDRLSRSTAGLVMSWRAWDFGARAQRVQAAQHDADASVAAAGQAGLDLAHRIAQLHHEVLARSMSIGAREADTPLLVRIVAAQETLAARTLPAGTDAHAARLRLAQHLAQLDADRAQLARALSLLAAKAGVPPSRIQSLTPSQALPVPNTEPFDVWLERARQHPALRAAHLARQAAEARSDEARKARYPVVDVTAARYANRSGSSPVASGRGIVDEFGVQLNWTLFDGFGSRSRADAASAAATKAAHQVKDTEDEVIAAVSANLAELRGQVTAWVAARQRQDAAQAALDHVRRRLAASQATRLDEWEAELLVGTAARDVEQSRLSWWDTRNRLALDAGTLALLVPAEQVDAP